MMRYIDVCSGISAPTMAWKPLGWRALCFAEIEPAPRAVLAHHYPDVPLVGDFTQIEGDEYGPVDLLVGGTPCQDFSVAGLRAGLDGERGNLTLEYLRLADRARPRWLVWENVPGVLSIDGGRAFGAILGALGELGYGWAYRVLDAQHFGVPQRRRRVFVVGYLGDWRRAAAVLFERHSLQGHPPPRREAREGIAAGPAWGISSDCFDRSGEGAGGTAGERPGLGVVEQASPALRAKRPNAVAYGGNNQSGPIDVSTALNSHGGPHGRLDFESETFIAHSLRGEGFDASEDGTGRGKPLVPVAFAATDYRRGAFEAVDQAAPLTTSADRTRAAPICFTAKDHGADAGELAPKLRAGGHSGSHANAGVMPAVAIPLLEIGKGTTSRGVGPNGSGLGSDGDPMFPLQAGAQHGVGTTSAVRRLTPRECERLQGFPDDFTLVPYRKGMMADGPRYKMLGNSMAVPVVRWIGERIAMVDAICAQLDRAA